MSKVVVFFGGDSQVGTTMITQAVGETIAKFNKSVLLILASGLYGNDYIKCNSPFSLDDIKSNITSKSLTLEDVEGILLNYNGMKILPGIRNIVNIKYYSEEDLKDVVELSKNKYDIILIDGGSNIQFGLNISALKYGEYRYYVITQREKSIRRFIENREKVLKPLDYNGKIVLNQYEANIGTYGKKEIESCIHDQIDFVIPLVQYGWMAEENKTTLLKDSKFLEAINTLSKDIAGESCIVSERKSFFKW